MIRMRGLDVRETILARTFHISILPAGTPLVLRSRREKNCIIGIISSRLAGMLSPGRRYRLISTEAKTCLSLSSEEDVTADWSEPAQTRTGVLLGGFRDAGAEVGRPAPMLMMPPSSMEGLSAGGEECQEEWVIGGGRGY